MPPTTGLAVGTVIAIARSADVAGGGVGGLPATRIAGANSEVSAPGALGSGLAVVAVAVRYWPPRSSAIGSEKVAWPAASVCAVIAPTGVLPWVIPGGSR